MKMQFIIARLQSVRLKVIWNYWKKTLKSLNTNVCPISSRLICTSDRTPLKSEFEDQIQKSNEGIKKNTDFIKRCEKEVQIRTERLDAYQKQQISYNNKKNLHDQIQNYVPITVMEKPEEVKAKYESGVLTIALPKEDARKCSSCNTITIE